MQSTLLDAAFDGAAASADNGDAVMQASDNSPIAAAMQSASASFPSGSGAASLLMAASELAQTPAQQVSSALLDKVHLAATEGRIHQSRRGSVEDGMQAIQQSIATSFSGAASLTADFSAPLAAAATNTRLGSMQQQQPVTSQNTVTGQQSTILGSVRQRQQTGVASSMSTNGQLTQLARDTTAPEVTDTTPYVPQSQAHLEVGQIAASTAAHQYIEQSLARLSAMSSTRQPHQWDDRQPMQGVPSSLMTPSASLAMIPPPDVVMGVRTPFATSQRGEAASTRSGFEASTTFQPAYQLAPQEYQILASAAAVATAALTTANTSGGAYIGSKAALAHEAHAANPSVDPATTRALTPAEQEEIASTLRAWAGLEGPQRQEQARVHLQALQGESRAEGSAQNGLGEAVQPGAAQSTPQFFPPDFARHYQSQLTALAAGYYSKLHGQGLRQTQWAPSTASATRLQSSVSGGPATHQDGRARAASSHAQQNGHIQGASHDAVAHGSANGAPLAASRAPASVLDAVKEGEAPSDVALASPPIRDQLLQYAHQLYSTGSKTVEVKTDEASSDSSKNPSSAPKSGATQTKTELHPQLLPLLHTLHNLHPQHLPTLLLLSCAYYSAGDMAASLWYNKQILSIDPNYVESMSNIGTTLRALNRWKEAESWWWRAIRLRPGYWDAYENLLGVLCSPQQMPTDDDEHERAERIINEGVLPSSPRPASKKPEQVSPRFEEALRLCEYVEANVMSKRLSPGERRHRKVPSNSSTNLMASSLPKSMPMHLPLSQFTRLQNLYYAKGNLKYVISGMGSVPASLEYEHAIEIMLSPSEDRVYNVRDLVLATYICGILSLGASLPGTNGAQAAEQIARAVGIDVTNTEQVKLASSGHFHALCPGGGLLRLAREAGDAVAAALLQLGGGTQLPMLMLIPKAAEQLSKIIFAETDGSLPTPVEGARRANASADALKQSLQQASNMTSTVLLTLAKLIQDATTTTTSGPHGPLTLGGIPPSVSLILPLYYLSISLNPAASTANNLGILLSAIPVTTTVIGVDGERQQVNGQALAMQYYTFGLQLDSKHPHLYTNLGSLLKDLNHLPDAIQMYEKAIACNPDFDVALANLGNAIKDQGRTQDSVQFYRRAVKVNPRFPEALCGLVNALLAICDWEDVYADDDEGQKGYMKEVRGLLDKQLEDGALYGAGALSNGRTPEDWSRLIAHACGDSREIFKTKWTQRIQAIIDPETDLRGRKINEGSFIIRIVERMMRETQRRWYRDRYGKRTKASASEKLTRIRPSPTDATVYARALLPTSLGTPNVPTVLPFHTFTLKISPRQIRLISHRTALRITQTTLTQQWLPAHVYPPPAPPAPRIKVGYISSDFNNHPLAHLMQSCFGFHDRAHFEIFLYATTASDHSPYRNKIEREAEHFVDVSSWSNAAVIERLQEDGIHLLMNLNGYTKGARNEIFAARPCPVQMEFMGFAGGLASGWTDWVVVDPIVCPPQSTSTELWRKTRSKRDALGPSDFDGDLDPEGPSEEWEYTEKFIYMPHTYFVNDHKQGFREPEERKAVDGSATVRPHEMSEKEAWREEEERRWKARKELWPSLPDDYVIFCDFNQLYKIEPTNFRLWLRILARVPKSILWLLRFPAAGEANLLQFARKEFGDEVAARVVFTDVAPKGVHIQRGRIADIFLDTLECGAHTTSADILWSGTPVLTWPKYEHKMASRVAASIVAATGLGDQMIVSSEQEYEDRAVALAKSIHYEYVDENGQILEAKRSNSNEDQRVTAKDLVFCNTSASAASHTAAVNGAQPKNSAEKSGSGASTPQSETSRNPAPANVREAAADSLTNRGTASTGQMSASNAVDTVFSNRAAIELAPTETIAPAGTISRRGIGELADLRRRLFMTRDSSMLFDTKRWVKNLEQGYTEAWRRWVLGIDTEESTAWEDLDDHDPIKMSGHIWVRDEEA